MNENLKDKALEILQKEQTQLEGVYDKQSEYQPPQTVEKISVVQGPDGRWSKTVTEEQNTFLDEGVIGKLEKDLEDDAITLQQYCKEFDDEIISFNNQINELKSQIVVLSTEAIGRNCWPGIAYSTTTTSGTTRNTGIGSTTQNYGGDISYKQDRDGLKIYESMSGPNSNYVTDNPFSPDSIVTLSAPYSGFGYENVRQDDGGGIIGIARTTISGIAGTHLGPKNVGAFRAYAGVGVSPEATITDLTGSDGDSRCISIANSISSLLSQIDALRTQRENLFYRNNLNVIKSVKKEKELQVWGTKNLNNRIQTRKSKNSDAINAIISTMSVNFNGSGVGVAYTDYYDKLNQVQFTTDNRTIISGITWSSSYNGTTQLLGDVTGASGDDIKAINISVYYIHNTSGPYHGYLTGYIHQTGKPYSTGVLTNNSHYDWYYNIIETPLIIPWDPSGTQSLSMYVVNAYNSSSTNQYSIFQRGVIKQE